MEKPKKCMKRSFSDATAEHEFQSAFERRGVWTIQERGQQLRECFWRAGLNGMDSLRSRWL